MKIVALFLLSFLLLGCVFNSTSSPTSTPTTTPTPTATSTATPTITPTPTPTEKLFTAPLETLLPTDKRVALLETTSELDSTLLPYNTTYRYNVTRIFAVYNYSGKELDVPGYLSYSVSIYRFSDIISAKKYYAGSLSFAKDHLNIPFGQDSESSAVLVTYFIEENNNCFTTKTRASGESVSYTTQSCFERNVFVNTHVYYRDIEPTPAESVADSLMQQILSKI